MQSVQRQFGKLLNKGPGENAKVAVLLKDYEDADNVLAQVLDNAKMWRDSWSALVTSQLQAVTEFEGLYDPIVGATDGSSRHSVPTPPLQLERTFRLKKAYTDLKAELVEEMILIEDHIMKPVTDARGCIAPIRKTIKKRENKRLDYEKAQEKTLKLQRKPGRTPKEDAALAKADAEMSRAAEEFGIADEHLRHTLPPIINAAFNLVPPLLSNLVMIQNRLLGLYYTTLNAYCEDFGFPSPPPPMQDVIDTWNDALGPIRSEIETISFIGRGRAVQQPMSNGSGPTPGSSPIPINGARRTPSGLISGPQARTLRVPSMPREGRTTPSPSSSYKRPDYLNATDFTTATILGGSSISRSAGGGDTTPASQQQQQRDYFSPMHQQQQQQQQQQRRSPSPAMISTNGGGLGLGLGKKKPPPPPPKKRAALSQPDEWVVAQYAFAGQGGGDLSFQQGDRIRVVKKTGTDQDWWVGELGGAKGNFPANYCTPL
ncbi:hypothetical protein C8A00DRAFT_45743 [Chaetomidium leptoderma]|uniref:SH3 domain-containing protein n=1 Tax=Chaetomidium leptoderma TaxID=669021 RepID=A0AAN6VG96_9PEZI|nr:hypothetical protein C8A00DRAFT_45743 [Chaetomidium leptoderma]